MDVTDESNPKTESDAILEVLNTHFTRGSMARWLPDDAPWGERRAIAFCVCGEALGDIGPAGWTPLLHIHLAQLIRETLSTSPEGTGE